MSTSFPVSSTSATSWWSSAQSIPHVIVNFKFPTLRARPGASLRRARRDLIGGLVGPTSDEQFAAPAPRPVPGLWKELGGSRDEGKAAVRTAQVTIMTSSWRCATYSGRCTVTGPLPVERSPAPGPE